MEATPLSQPAGVEGCGGEEWRASLTIQQREALCLFPSELPSLPKKWFPSSSFPFPSSSFPSPLQVDRPFKNTFMV